jgi:hypothetical protein
MAATFSYPIAGFLRCVIHTSSVGQSRMRIYNTQHETQKPCCQPPWQTSRSRIDAAIAVYVIKGPHNYNRCIQSHCAMIDTDSPTLLYQKILRLTNEPTSDSSDEAKLVALVLLTRLERLPQDSPLSLSLLVDFVNDLVAVGSCLYGRLAAQLLRHEPATLGTLLVSLLAQQTAASAPLSPADVDMVANLNAYYLKQHIVNDKELVNALETIWERYQICSSLQQPLESTARTNPEDLESAKAKTNNAACEPTTLTIEDSDATMFQQVLTSIYNQNSTLLSSSTDLQDAWMEETTALFLEHAASVASCVPSILSWWFSKKNNNKPCTSIEQTLWAQVLLASIQSQLLLLQRDGGDNGSSSSSSGGSAIMKQLLLDESTYQLLVACIVSPNNNIANTNLRAMAWSTLTTAIGTCGWTWLVHDNHHGCPQQQEQSTFNVSSSSSLGNGGKICTLLRLAAGEFKLQLASVVDDHHHDSLVLEATAQLLTQAVTFLCELAEKEQSATVLSGDALLHLRQSLDEAMDATLQYCALYNSACTQSTTANNISSSSKNGGDSIEMAGSTVVAQVLSALIVLHQPCADEQWSALRVALAFEPTDASLLHALSVFFRANDDDYDFVKQHELPLAVFLQRYFNQHDDETISTATHVAEEWIRQSTVPINVTALQETLLEWLERATTEQHLSDVVAAVFGCYVTLQGDDEPGERETTILKRALDRFELGENLDDDAGQ